MSEINLKDHKSISAGLFPDKGFCEAVCELDEYERDNSQILEKSWIQQSIIFLVDFMPFLNFFIEVGHNALTITK